VPTTKNPQSVHQARIAAVVVLITAFFGALWGLMGAAALPGTPSSVAALLTVVVTTTFLLAAARLLLLSRRLPRSSASAGTNPFRSRAYLLAVLFEVVAIPVAVVLLNRTGYPGAVGSAIVAIVGLHFFGLVPAFKSRRFAAVGGAMVLVGLLSLLLPSVAGGASGVDPRGAATGLGSALVFWVGVLPLVISAWPGFNVRSD
jgi:hypothetical protein